MIKKIYIENYRSIKKIEINKIGNALGLIGENSSGKSSILNAVLVALQEKTISKTDFRFDKDGQRSDKIIIGIGLEFDEFATKRMIEKFGVYDSSMFGIHYNRPAWYSKALKITDITGRRNRESKSFLEDLRRNVHKVFELNNSSVIYFRYTYFLSDVDNFQIDITDSLFKEKYVINESKADILLLKNILQPKYAYLKDERDFNGERKGSVDSTTNKLFRLLLPAIKTNNEISEEQISTTPIYKLSIPQINKYLLKKVQEEALGITTNLNKHLKENYNENVEIEWNFSNSLYDNIEIKTNFKIAGINNEIDFQSVGSGTRNMYKIVLLQTLLEENMFEKEPVLFILEEPELYLYPKLEKQMAEFIYEMSRNNQVFVSTHSHMVIMNFDNESIYKISRISENSILPITKANKINSSLEAIEMLGYDVTYFLGKDYLIFVEGKDDDEAYGHLIKTVFGKEISSKFVVMEGVIKLAQSLNFKFLDKIQTKAKSVYIIDSDGNEPNEVIDKYLDEISRYDSKDEKIDLEELRKKVIVTKYCMLECYTFEYELLKDQKNMSFQEYENRKHEFINKYEDKINNVLSKRKKKTLNEIDESNQFEYIRKYGFNKDLVKKFRGVVGGQGFEGIKQLDKEQLNKYCKSLIDDLKEKFGLD